MKWMTGKAGKRKKRKEKSTDTSKKVLATSQSTAFRYGTPQSFTGIQRHPGFIHSTRQASNFTATHDSSTSGDGNDKSCDCSEFIGSCEILSSASCEQSKRYLRCCATMVGSLSLTLISLDSTPLQQPTPPSQKSSPSPYVSPKEHMHVS